MYNYDTRIMIVVVLFIGVYMSSCLKWYGVKDFSPAKNVCQQLDVASFQLIPADCKAIINSSVKSTNFPNVAVFFFDPISINEASYELLQTVKGVGPKLAQKIITYRTKVGPFIGVESIKNMTGVGEKRAQYLATQFSFN